MTPRRARPARGGESTSGCFLRCYDNQAMPTPYSAARAGQGPERGASAHMVNLKGKCITLAAPQSEDKSLESEGESGKAFLYAALLGIEGLKPLDTQAHPLSASSVGRPALRSDE